MAQVLTLDTRRFMVNSNLLKSIIERKTVKALEDIGEFVASEAKDRAPIDEGFLTEDIETEVYPADRVAVVRVPVNAPSSEYAIKMHEDPYNLGEKSAAKEATLNVKVGQKYISRAIDENASEIKDIIKKDMRL